MGKTTRLAITMGDPFGVGPEVIRAALEAHQREDGAGELTIYGAAELFDGLPVVDVPIRGERPEQPGPSAAGGQASLAALHRALEDLAAGKQDALVTAPISKQSWALAEGPVDGHTPLLGRFFGAEPLMAFAWDRDEPVVALLTVHIPLRAVPASLTGAKVERAVRTLDEALRRCFGCAAPRIGVLGLNPHAGEGGLLGTEDADFVAPAVARLAKDGFLVEGPLPGDTAFAIRSRFDGLLALYHDQGLAPVKAIAFHRAVNITLGLPIIRTSPAHGTAFDLAGQGQANPTSMRAAIHWAMRLQKPV